MSVRPVLLWVNRGKRRIMSIKTVEALWVRCGAQIGGTADDIASPYDCLCQEAVDLKASGFLTGRLRRYITEIRPLATCELSVRM
jgi:hypothetical protein